ncbi:glycosyltransferase [Cerasicoccus arenae]|uniref:D-inositol 3-phosphate glycosyltransferase n=1 Tax=Cerasicoccus arenae TaxID=424488 RepID=A0A8J3GDJ3_9BACT|nr:glycosyltransferase [Cerasicoccus arenae]MBK1858066.1 glycosyltransferase [Cerasicoccus arenae]GHC06860.1 hypothetical protein GCM10007047_24890 [Cerasicoccus arenae]
MMSAPHSKPKSAGRRVLMSTSVFPRWAGDDTPPFVLGQAEAIAAAGWSVTVLAPHAGGGVKNERLGGVDVVRFPYLWPESWQGLCYEGGMLVQLREHPHRKWQLPFFFLAQVMATRRLARSGDFDLLHAHSLLPQGLTALVGGHCLPVIATSHGSDVFGLKEGGVYGRLKRRVVTHADALTANSSVTEAALLRLGATADRIHRVPASPNVTPADSAKVAAIRKRFEGGKLLLFVGRLIEQKGVGDLITALNGLDASAHLLVLGEGADRAKFEQLARALGVADRVTFDGWVDRAELSHYFAAADVFVGPSKPGPGGAVEAQGVVFAEAMAAGTPVVASRCGGIVDMIIDGETGLLVEPGVPSQIATAVRRVLVDPDLAGELVAKARQRYETEFSPGVVTQKLLRVYDGLLSGGRG